MEATAPPVEVARHESGFLQRVFMWMFLGLLVTGGTAAAIGSSDQLLTDLTENPLILLGVIAAQLGLVIFISFRINSISPATATILFLIYAATVGVTFALIFELYTAQSIFTTFLITAGMFGALAVWGALTDMDLSKVGAIAFMGLIGLILATIVNIFWANETLYWITTYAGVLIFAALTAYDMQKLTQISKEGLTGDAEGRGATVNDRTLAVEAGADGVERCWWCLGSPDLIAYHDEEWGRELHGEAELYERLTLEAFQSGLSWTTILRKRENFRKAFDGFDIERVAEYGKRELDELVWSFAPDPQSRPVPKVAGDLDATSDESKAMAKELKRRGFVFVGPTTAYATMEAIGMVNDHLADCAFRNG